MDYCAPLGIPHSVFLSWDELDKDKAMAWYVRHRSRCRECGVPAAEAGEFVAEAYRCLSCEQLEILKIDPVLEGKGMKKRAVPRELVEEAS